MRLRPQSGRLSTLFVLVLVGCLPPAGAPERPRLASSVRVPAGVGAIVEVPVASLLQSDPAWRRLSDEPGTLELSVRYMNEPVPCVVYGGADGRLDDGDTIGFTVNEQNRHSPWLTYQIIRATPTHDERGHAPPGRLCRLADRAASASPVDTLVGRTVAPAMRDTAAGRDDPPVDARTWDRWRHADYLVVAPRDWRPSVQPLVDHRTRVGHTVASLAVEDVYARYSGRNPTPEALRAAVRDFHRHTSGRLRYLLLVGDVDRQYEPATTGTARVPTFYRAKVAYPGYASADEYPTDHPYGVLEDARPSHSRRPAAEIAVGRLPARTRAEAAAMAQKIVAYETEDERGLWQRRLVMLGGPANFGELVDSIIEGIANQLLNHMVPYDYDLSVTFAKPGSPYAQRFDRLGKHIVNELNEGALFAAYIGHGQPSTFDYVGFRNKYYEIGTAEQLRTLNIPSGKPFFLSFTCHTGAYDREAGEPSLAEVMAIGREGPIAVFASSRESHPYPNALYASGFIRVFLQDQPVTLGDGLLALKRELRSGRMLLAETLVGQSVSELKAEHEGLYNLLGDPATRLRYPEPLRVTAPELLEGGQAITVQVASEAIVTGTATVTLETERIEIQHELVPWSRIEKMSMRRALTTIAQNHERATDKVLDREQAPLESGKVEVTLRAPTKPGPYVLKAWITDGTHTAAGHTTFTVVR